MTVAALFVEPNGVCASFKNVEIWDASRDARSYQGPHPAAATPPAFAAALLLIASQASSTKTSPTQKSSLHP